MKIDLTKLKKILWYEDIDGNKYYAEGGNLPDEPLTYHVIHICEAREELISYDYHPEHLHENNELYQAMINFRWFRKLMYKRMKRSGKRKTFKPIVTFNSTWSGSQDVILAMANSGDYTLPQAIHIWTNACERCMNVLAHKYLNGKDGYEEGSPEWKHCNTVCDFCREVKEYDNK